MKNKYYYLLIWFVSIFSTHGQIPSLYEQSVTAVFKKLEKEHSVEKLLNVLDALPTQVALHVVYRVVLANTMYTLAERKEILENFVQSHKLELTSRQRQSLELVRTTFIDRLIKRQKTAQVPNITSIVNEKLNINGETPLFKAVQFDDKDLVQELIKAGASINIFDKNGRSPLLYVKSVHVLNVLLNNGVDVNSVSNFGPFGKSKMSALSYLIEFSSIPIPELISSLVKANVYFYDDKNSVSVPCENKQCIITWNPDRNVLIELFKYGCRGGIRLLIENKPELLNLVNFYGGNEFNTFLDYIDGGYMLPQEFLDYLISKGAKRFGELFPNGIPADYAHYFE